MGTVKDCLGTEINEGDFVIYVVQGNRNAGINFGWVDKIVDKSESGYSETYKVRIIRADADGTKETVRAVDVPGHWRAGTPDHVENPTYTGNTSSRSYDDFDKYYVHQTYRDTGKPSTTMLTCDGTEHRLLVTKPYI